MVSKFETVAFWLGFIAHRFRSRSWRCRLPDVRHACAAADSPCPITDSSAAASARDQWRQSDERRAG